MILTKTPREIEKARREQRYDLAAPASCTFAPAWTLAHANSLPMLAVAILVFVVSLAYCTITPIITPFAFIFFGLGYLALRYSHCKRARKQSCPFSNMPLAMMADRDG